MTDLIKYTRSLLVGLMAVAFYAPMSTASAQYEPTQEEIDAYVAWEEEFDSSLNRMRGEIKLLRGKVTINIPADYYFLDKKDGRAVLEDGWGNAPDSSILGMIFPSKYSPMDEGSWGVIVYWDGDGYVSDEDAQTIDYHDLLAEMKKDTAIESRQNERMGFDSVKLVGWAEQPTYNAKAHTMYWALALVFGDGEDQTLNYDMRVLGRRGVLTLTYVAAMDQLDEVRASREDLLSMTSFSEGNRYADYKPGDKKAEYGLAVLVAGGAGAMLAKKAGFLGLIMIVFKKFFVFILAGLAFLLTRIKGLFGGNKS
jgi:uncharacterized membrane-anchored protein